MDVSQPLAIGQVAALAGVSISKIRYYEKRGLVASPPRVGGQRRFDTAVLMRLLIIQVCQAAGLTLSEIADVLGDTTPERTLTKRLARAKLLEIDDQIDQLRLAKLMLEATIECSCPTVEDCQCGAMAAPVTALRARLI